MKYSQDYPEQLRNYARLNLRFGATQEELAAMFGVSRRTIVNWLGKYPEFRDAVRELQSNVDDMVESALLQSALGYDYTETKTAPGRVEETTKHVTGNVAAQKFWLINRRPDQWRGDQVQISGHITTQQNHELKLLVDDVLNKHPEAKAELVAKLRAECENEITDTD